MSYNEIVVKIGDAGDGMEICKIFGVRTGAFSMAEALNWVCGKLDELKGQYVTFANTHVIVTASEEKGYCRVQNLSLIHI